MALTLEAEQRLENAGLVKVFVDHELDWLALAKQTKGFVKANFPHGSKIRRDDVAKAFFPILEVHELLRDTLDSNKLRGKFWIRDFGDLIIDRTWSRLDEGDGT
jgi:hypothetical protein